MKKINVKEAIVTILTILLLPVVVLSLLALLIKTPFDYIKYKRTRYFKDTGEKYSWLCTSSFHIKLYDAIKRESLPIEYYRGSLESVTGYGYFLYKNILILIENDLHFDVEKNIFTIEIEDEYVDMKHYIQDAIKECNDHLKDEICKKAIVLIDGDIYNEHLKIKDEWFELVPIYNDNVMEALKSIVN